MNLTRTAAAAIGIADDIRRHLRDEAHRSRLTTYIGLRKAYVLTRGRSSVVVASLIRIARMRTKQVARELRDELGIAVEVVEKGYAVREGFVSGAVVRDLRTYFDDKPGTAIGEGFARTGYDRVSDLDRGLKFDYGDAVILAAPHLLDIVSSEALVGAAFHYLRSEPILTNINVWWSMADPDANSDQLSGAAQLYHFDHDYPAFIKFFIYLTDVTIEDGPLTYIEGTHRRKPLWKDDRYSDDELLRELGLGSAEKPLLGPAGTLIAADTLGFHKGTPVHQGPRFILQVEYAVSRLGASAHYGPYPANIRPSSVFPRAFARFSGPPGPSVADRHEDVST